MITKTTCPYCGVGCGVEVRSEPGGKRVLSGDRRHPANFGRLCSKGAALGETLGLEGRLLYPQVDGRKATWDEALDRVAEGFRRAIVRHGPGSVAFYVSGQLLTEDYYVANKLMKGFIGGANIDTNSRLCMSSSVAGHVRAFGSDSVPGCYEDLELADLILLVGSNTAWCHPVLFQRIRQARQQRPGLKVVVIDPRRTATCDIADLHLPLAPGTDVALFNGLLDYLDRTDAVNWEFVVNATNGFSEALQAARVPGDPIYVTAARCGLSEQATSQLFDWFAGHEKTVTVYSQGVNQWSCGTDKVNSIINCHLATGRIGRPGMGPFSLTGQPNAMGGREVGGLANQLAAHMGFDPASVDRVGRFWNTSALAREPGLKAVDLFNAVAEGKVKALWIMATNPVASLPDADRALAALRRCELVVVSDNVCRTDTADCADVLLPAAAWGEKDGTVTNSERRISRQRAFLPLPGEARPDWWIITQVAHRLGFGSAFDYRSPADVFREHAALSGFENGGSRDFDISGLAGLSQTAYDGLEPLQWPVREGSPSGTPRLFGGRRYFNTDRRSRLVPVGARSPAFLPDDAYPLVLNTGRVRDQWHTMTRTGSVPRLCSHRAEPYVEIHPADAAARGLPDKSLARLASPRGEMLARIEVTDAQRPGSVFVPMHWTDQFAAQGRVNALTNAALDPVSGQPEFKHTPVRVDPLVTAWEGFVLSRGELTATGTSYLVRVAGEGCIRYEIAGAQVPGDSSGFARQLLGAHGEWLEYEDRAAGRFSAARLLDGVLDACIFLQRAGTLPERNWLSSLFAAGRLAPAERGSLLSGRPPRGVADQGRIVCACFSVGLNTLTAAIETQGLTSVEAIGAALRAGSNCGSCIPELRGLLGAVNTA